MEKALEYEKHLKEEKKAKQSNLRAELDFDIRTPKQKLEASAEKEESKVDEKSETLTSKVSSGVRKDMSSIFGPPSAAPVVV